MLFICSCDCLNTGGHMGIKIIKNNKLWMEDEAIHQLERISQFEDVLDIVGLPDLHPSKVPVGATIKTSHTIYPLFVGNDVGCGMSLYATNIKSKKLNVDKIVKKLADTKIYGEYSIGGGNHFAELQIIDKLYDDTLSINKKNAYLLIHSGSRRLGEEIYRKYASLNGLKEGSLEFNEYILEHEKAVHYAKENRCQIANIFMDLTGLKYRNELVIDCVHNYIEKRPDGYYHHKGSISSFNEYAVIAGSRGTYSYLVRCIPQQETLYSISHGAGRKWARHLCKGRLVNKYKREELKTTQLGGKVITNDNALLYEEASEAYKDIDEVIKVLLEYETIEIIARLRPVVTYKC